MLTLVLPPLTQLNTPYPSTAFLARALRARGVACAQRDLGLELVLRLFSAAGLAKVFDALEGLEELPDPAWRALALREPIQAAVGPVIQFLQGKDRALGPRILHGPFLPLLPRSGAARLDGFGPLAVDDAARHLATAWLADLADLVAVLDPGFALARYQHHLAAGPARWAPLAARLAQTTVVDALLDELGDGLEGVVGLSVPFPGNLYGALRLGRRLRARGVHVLMGGGFVSTELREVDEPGLWDCVDELVYDDGEGPILAILEARAGGPDRRHRTRLRDGMRTAPALAVEPAFAADYEGLPLDAYLQLVDGPNPAHRLWSDGRWNKIQVAHGCYWKKCSFCDTALPYVADYRPHAAQALVDEVERLIAATGQRGFHLVDEAAPPARLRDFALEILRRGLVLSWWGNVRFEAAFGPDLARLLAASGCVALTGGLEVASDRLLARMQKGVSLDQVVRVGRALRGAGILVHAYLMYGFPTETEAETVDSMELVRQLFAEGVVDSAFWHRFVLTRHSPIAADPAAWGLRILDPGPRFAANDLDHDDGSGVDHDRFDAPLASALAAWMRGEALDRPVTACFDHPVPAPSVAPDRVASVSPAPPATRGRLLWLGGELLEDDAGFVLHHVDGVERLRLPAGAAEVLAACGPRGGVVDAAHFAGLAPATWAALRRAGLVVIA